MKPTPKEVETVDVTPSDAISSDTIPPEDRSGARRRWVRGGVLLAVGIGAAFLMMANSRQLPHGALWGVAAMLLAAIGFLEVTGLFARRADRSWRDTTLGPNRLGNRVESWWMTPSATVPAAMLVSLVGILAFGYGALPAVVAVALFTLAPSAWTRPGMLVFVVAGLVHLPLLGTFGLWDPWETHYGEVAREILARDDWISLWWAQDGWFWSKPILIFWTEALSLSAFGVEYWPDANPPHPEWALRLPVAAFSLAAVQSVYFATSRIFRRRAGVLAALVLATVPHFVFLSHQAITDMLLVAPMTIAVGLLSMALATGPEAVSPNVRVGRVSLGLPHLVIGALLIVVVPQVFYLLTRNVSLLPAEDVAGDPALPYLFAWHGDRFASGSAGNTAVPGNAGAADAVPYLSAIYLQPFVQGVVWLLALAVLLFATVRERRTQGLLMIGFYFFCGLAFMGKGIPGFALPGMVSLLYLIGSKRWALLLEGRLRVGLGMLIVATVGLPWYVAMFVRHGPPFMDRLFIHDHINRLAAGVHGDTGSIEYFIEQLGFATFPWVALIPAALTLWLWWTPLGDDSQSDGNPSDTGPTDTGPTDTGSLEFHRRQTLLLLSLWFVGAFTLFSVMVTKFHHYIFPAVPPAAILVGILLDRLTGDVPPASGWRTLVARSLAYLSPIPLVAGIGGAWGDLVGRIPADVPASARADWVLDQTMHSGAIWGLLALGVGTGALAVWGLRVTKSAPLDGAEFDRRLAATVAVTATIAIVFVGRDLSWVTAARPQGYERLIQLFVYSYGRPWPDYLDYRPVLTGFAIVSTGLVGLLVVPWLRRYAARGLVGVAVIWAAWCLDVYMVELSPHWGQRELVKRYYELREGEDQPLVAWQMNWKGENLYTGNRVAVFVDLDNTALREWMAKRQGERAFFLLEHSRLGGFRGLLSGKSITEHTDKRFNNKFILVSAEL